MSRSYRNTPIITVGPYAKAARQEANRRVRHTKVVGNNSSYKRHFEQWDIYDYKFRDTLEHWLAVGEDVARFYDMRGMHKEAERVRRNHTEENWKRKVRAK